MCTQTQFDGEKRLIHSGVFSKLSNSREALDHDIIMLLMNNLTY